MIQKQLPLPEPVSPCECGKPPKYYLILGKQLHIMECLVCNTRTLKHATFEECRMRWEHLRADMPVIAPPPPPVISDTVRQLRRKNG